MRSELSSRSGTTRRVTLVGAGPVGSLLALFLARRGYEVEVFERRPDMRKQVVDRGRSINLAVSTRGLQALSRVGLRDEVLSHAIPMHGRMMHSLSGELTFQPYGKDRTETINSMSRAGLNALLMTRAEETGKVTIHFQSRITDMDFDSGLLSVRDESSGATRAVSPELVVGTDGSASALRAAMVKRLGAESDESPLDYGYKELVLPAGPNGSTLIEKNALHIWPRGTYMFIALPNEDGSFTCTLFLPFKGDVSFEALTTAQEVDAFFTENFPDARALIPDLAETFFENPTGHMVTVRCDPWHFEDRALLLGDASHAIVPFFGQGMNAGFEDCTVLDGLLERFAGNWSQVIPEFARLRKPDADAIAELALDNFIEMRDRVGNARFLLEKEIEKRLESEFPDLYRSRYRIVTFSDLPYRVALEAGRIQSGILSKLSSGLERADQIDFQLAEKLIREQLAPVLSPFLSSSSAEQE